MVGFARRVSKPPAKEEAKVTLTALCWACDQPQQRRVRANLRDHRHFHWTCDDCDVTWSGPGTAAA